MVMKHVRTPHAGYTKEQHVLMVWQFEPIFETYFEVSKW